MDNRFGNDIMMDNGDVMVSSSGDLFTTRDYDNLKSDGKFPGYYNMLFSLLNRLNTQKGSNPFHPNYGSNLQKILSSPNANGFSDYVSNEISDTLLEDGRIRSIKSIGVTQAGDKLYVNVNVELVESGTVVEFIFPNFVIG